MTTTADYDRMMAQLCVCLDPLSMHDGQAGCQGNGSARLCSCTQFDALEVRVGVWLAERGYRFAFSVVPPEEIQVVLDALEDRVAPEPFWKSIVFGAIGGAMAWGVLRWLF